MLSVDNPQNRRPPVSLCVWCLPVGENTHPVAVLRHSTLSTSGAPDNSRVVVKVTLAFRRLFPRLKMHRPRL